MIIAVDFDGTIVAHEFPRIGKPVPGALETLRELITEGHLIILYTMRSGSMLAEAVRYLQKEGIGLWGINANPDQSDWTTSPKAYAQLYIDDATLGCPLVQPVDPEARPYVDWNAVRKILNEKYVIPPFN